MEVLKNLKTIEYTLLVFTSQELLFFNPIVFKKFIDFIPFLNNEKNTRQCYKHFLKKTKK
jgi:hypothetical protein